MSILINIGDFLLIIVSILLVLVVLAQRAKSDGGVGAAMGGGIAEATFGADTGNVLSKTTINLSIAFFVLAFLTGLGTIHQHRKARKADDAALPTISAPAAPAPAAPEGAAVSIPAAAPTPTP